MSKANVIDAIVAFKEKYVKGGRVRIGWSNMLDLYDDLCNLIEQVEAFGGLTGKEKKAIVIEVMLARFNIKIVPDTLERLMWGVLIDGAVYLMNKYQPEWVENLGVEDLVVEDETL